MFLWLIVYPVVGLDNGLGLTPPMGWRSWNLYGSRVSQDLLESIMHGMVSRKRTVDGVPTSLADLGYNDVGLDDNWQLCGSYGPEKYTFHSKDAVYPVVDFSTFPDMLGMTNLAHSLNLTAGWYMNNCICEDHCSEDSCYRGDVAAIIEYGFDGVKLDSCSTQLDLDLWQKYLNASLRPILIENCHQGHTIPNSSGWCPFNYYRTSKDVRASYGSVMTNLATMQHFAVNNLSYPGCWAYPDMLEVGCEDGPHGIAGDPGLSFGEARSHFAAWAVVSSPLILSMDVTNDTVMDTYWDLIANPEIIKVNQAWYGHAGSAYALSSKRTKLGPDSLLDSMYYDDDIEFPSWQMFYKPIDASSTAVLVLNSAELPATLTVDFGQVPDTPCLVTCALRDLFDRTDIGIHQTNYTFLVDAHDAAFFLLKRP